MDKIGLYLAAHPQGAMAKDIAKFLDLPKKEVSAFLCRYPDRYRQGTDFSWTLRSADFASDPVLQKLQNRERAGKFTDEQFRALADWSRGARHTDSDPVKVYTTLTGNVIDCDSLSETAMLRYLEERSFVTEVGGQALELEYCTSFRSGVKYYPDIVAHLKDGSIAVIEVKSDSAMDYHLNVEKYEALKAYCRRKGFLYMMVDPYSDFFTFEELCSMEIAPELLEFFEEWDAIPDTREQPFKVFNEEDVANWYAMYGEGCSEWSFKRMVHALVVSHGWYNVFQNGFLVFSRPVKIIDGEVADWEE